MLHTVGNGLDTSHRHSAIQIRQNGDIYIADSNKIGQTNPDTNNNYNYYDVPMIKLQDALAQGGQAGPQGAQGEVGPQGPQGAPGTTGPAPGFQQLVNPNNANKVGLVNSLVSNYDTNIGEHAVIEGDGAANGVSTYRIIASGAYAHAEGCATQATGARSHAEGSESKATGEASHAEGSSTTAQGYNSHAEGNSTIANGEYSHVEGYGCTSTNKAVHGHAEGRYNTVNNNSEHAEGFYALSVAGNSTSFLGNDTATLHIIGNGNGTNARHNAFEIKQNGDIYYADTQKIDGSTVHYYDCPTRKLQDAMVTSTTNGLKIEVVAALPQSPENNVLYIVI